MQNDDKNYLSKNCKIDPSSNLESPVRFYGSVVIKAKCKLGKFTFVNSGTTLFRGTEIGRFCSIGKNCEIGAFDHPIDWLSSSPIQYNIAMHFPDYVHSFKQQAYKRPASTIIGNDVWIGSLAIIKRGVIIGDGAIIAWGAVVIGDVPPYAIVGGVPAKILKYRFEPEIVEQLLSLKWWDMSAGKLQNLPWNDVKAVIKQLKVDDLKQILSSSDKNGSITSVGIEAEEFYARFSYSLLEHGVSKEVVAAILNELNRSFVQYNWEDVYDIEIFNNKMSLLIDLIETMDEKNALDFKKINTLFRTKQ